MRRLGFYTIILSLISMPAYAYIDPSGGSLWIQSLIAIFAAVGTAIRVYWHKIKQKIFKKRTKKIDEQP